MVNDVTYSSELGVLTRDLPTRPLLSHHPPFPTIQSHSGSLLGLNF